MTSSDSKAFFEFMDLHRGPRGRVEILKLWLDERPKLSKELLYDLTNDNFAFEFPMMPRRQLAEFIAALASLRKPATVFDPCCGTGLLLREVADWNPEAKIAGICQTDFECFIVGKLGDTDWEVRQRQTVSQFCRDTSERYDLITSFPPFGMRSPSDLDAPTREVALNTFIKATEYASSNGHVIMIIPNSAFLGQHRTAMLDALKERNFGIKALFHVPSGMLGGATISAYVAVLAPGWGSSVFLAQVPTSEAQRDLVISNYSKCKPSEEPALGRVVELDSFISYDQYLQSDRIRRLAKRTKWEKVLASDVIVRTSLVHQRSGQLEHGPSSCYVRLMGSPFAAINLADFPNGKPPREVAHLHLNTDRVLPAFFVRWVQSSSIGRSIFQMCMRGTAQQRLDLNLLLEAELYLPPIAEQSRLLSEENRIHSLQNELNELESVLWDGSDMAEGIGEALDNLNREDSLAEWGESLPFPMASVLWRFIAHRHDPRDSMDALLQFFEATASLLATIHLSAFSDDLERLSGLNERLQKQGLKIGRATFGSWKLIFEYFSSELGKMLPDNEMRPLAQDIFGTRSEKVLAMLSSQEIRSVLQQANSIRNNVSGHGGALSAVLASRTVAELELLVTRLRGAMGKTWAGYRLILPRSAKVSGGVFTFTSEIIVGSRSAPFASEAVRSLHSLDTDCLHFYDPVSETGLKMLPFVKVMPSPEKKATACFIFSRQEGDKARFISYHFEHESQITASFPEVSDLLVRLSGESAG